MIYIFLLLEINVFWFYSVQETTQNASNRKDFKEKVYMDMCGSGNAQTSLI